MRRTALLAGFSAATLLTGITFATANPTGPKSGPAKACDETTPTKVGYTLDWDPQQVFPPNHKPVDVTLTYTSPDQEDVELDVTLITNNEIVDGEELNGSGNTLVDSGGELQPAAKSSTGTVSQTVWVRAERSGQGEGRTYTINYTAKAGLVNPLTGENTGSSNDCSGSVDVFIPHDMGQGNDAKV
jgi:hypothetical protein